MGWNTFNYAPQREPPPERVATYRGWMALKILSLKKSFNFAILWFLNLFILSSGEDNGTPLQYSCLKNPIDGGAWWAAVHGITKSRTRLSDFTFTFLFPALEKEVATHSSVLAWGIPGMAESGGLPSVGLYRVWSDLAAAALVSCSWGSCLRSFRYYYFTWVLLPFRCINQRKSEFR